MTKEHHSHVCPWWAAYSFDNPLRRLIHNTHTILGPYLDHGMTAVDIGCGMGFFSIGMAALVGDEGKIISLDIQEQMLKVAAKRAAKKGMENRIDFRLTEADSLGLDGAVDFVMAFWVVHEVPDQDRLFSQISDTLKPGGRLLMTEPSFHVKPDQMRRSIEKAESAGLVLESKPDIRFCKSALFVKK